MSEQEFKKLNRALRLLKIIQYQLTADEILAIRQLMTDIDEEGVKDHEPS